MGSGEADIYQANLIIKSKIFQSLTIKALLDCFPRLNNKSQGRQCWAVVKQVFKHYVINPERKAEKKLSKAQFLHHNNDFLLLFLSYTKFGLDSG